MKLWTPIGYLMFISVCLHSVITICDNFMISPLWKSEMFVWLLKRIWSGWKSIIDIFEKVLNQFEIQRVDYRIVEIEFLSIAIVTIFLIRLRSSTIVILTWFSVGFRAILKIKIFKYLQIDDHSWFLIVNYFFKVMKNWYHILLLIE